MKRRARRVMILTAAPVAVLVAGLFVAHWSTVRDHVAAWHFQLTRETQTIKPVQRETGPGGGLLLHVAARQLGHPLIYDPAELADFEVFFECGSEPDAKAFLRQEGYRFLEQRLPRRAYVVMRDPLAVQATLLNEKRDAWVCREKSN